jgi:hypothetical protein
MAEQRAYGNEFKTLYFSHAVPPVMTVPRRQRFAGDGARQDLARES